MLVDFIFAVINLLSGIVLLQYLLLIIGFIFAIFFDFAKFVQRFVMSDTKIFTPFDFFPVIVQETFARNRVYISRAGICYFVLFILYALWSYFRVGWKTVHDYRRGTQGYSLDTEWEIVRAALYKASWNILWESMLLPYYIVRDFVCNIIPFAVITSYDWMYGAAPKVAKVN